MAATLKRVFHQYPRQFWLMFFGMLISTVGSSMIWPFLMIYLSESLDAPLTMAASLLTLNSAAGLVASLVWVLLPVYAKQNYHILENQYGWIATTNALMVVAFQVGVTHFTKRYRTLPVLGWGAFFYTLAVLSVARGSSFWEFWVSMVILTIGELFLVPTASTYAANLAHPEMRGRYMSIFGLAWRIAIGAGPILGGLLHDSISPNAIWYGGTVLGAASTLIFVLLHFQQERQKKILVK